MRSAPVAILLSTAVLLAGCSGGDGEDELHYTCPGGVEIHQDDHPDANTTADLAEFCPGSTTSGSRSSSTSQAPNVLPTLVLKVSDDGGNETPVTMLDGNLTFDASGSTDSDGSIAGIAVTITDSNTTRTATLYDAGKKQFKPATFKFDREGVVNVTVAMVDDRAGFTVNQTHVYVNNLQVIPEQTIQAAGGSSAVDESGCNGNDPLVDSFYVKPFTFSLVPGATFVEATVTTHDSLPDPAPDETSATITICSLPDADGVRAALSDSGDSTVRTFPDAALPAPTGTDFYQVWATAGVPNTTAGVTVLVHYEPEAAAAA